jgi:hypothetical protein
MELTYKQVPDGIKVPMEQIRTIHEMVDMVYKTLSTQGTLTTEQIKAYEDLCNIVTKL